MPLDLELAGKLSLAGTIIGGLALVLGLILVGAL